MFNLDQMFNLDAQFSTRVAITVDNSIDDHTSNSKDNGALEYARQFWCRLSSDGLVNGGINSSTAEAVITLDNILYSLPNADQTRAVIVGHGQPGLISTGGGMRPTRFFEYIAVGNQPDWSSEFHGLSHINELYLWGCHVGAGDAGADLLFHVAQVLNCSVWGYSGLVCIGPDGPAYEQGGNIWQMATSTQRPTPIHPPLRFQRRSKMDDIVIKSEKGMERFSAASTIQVTYQEPRGQSTWGTGFTMQGKEAEGLLQLIDFAHPYYLCPPMAIVTGKLTLAVKGNSHSPEVEREYIVYNDLLLGDSHFKDVYYDLASSFKATVRILMHANLG